MGVFEEAFPEHWLPDEDGRTSGNQESPPNPNAECRKLIDALYGIIPEETSEADKINPEDVMRLSELLEKRSNRESGESVL